MNSRLIVFVFLFAVGLLLNSCSKDTSEPALKKYPVSLSFKMPDPRSGSRVQSNDISLVVKALVTLTKEDGTATEFTRKVVEVFELDRILYSEEINLPAGGYLITELLLVDVEGTSLFAIPTEGNLEEYIDEQLPIPFEVVGQSTAKTVVLEVLSTLGFTPEDFGYDEDAFVFEVGDVFLVALRDKHDRSRYLKGTLIIGANEEIKMEVDSTKRVLLKEEYVKEDGVYVKVQSPGYYEYKYVFTKDSLLSHESNPLVVELENTQMKGGTYVGNVILETQQDVEAFALHEYEFVEGSLKIGPSIIVDKEITDISGLKSLKGIQGSFTLTDCDQLKNLEGLEGLESVGGYFTIEWNENLENLSGLENLSKIENKLSIQSNASLKTLSGLQGLKSLVGSAEIKGNGELINLEGLDNVQYIKYLYVVSNNKLTSFKGLANVNEIFSLSISNNSSLKDFSGFETSIGKIYHFYARQNENLESFDGLMSDSHGIEHGVDISENPSLKSLRGLNFYRDITFSFKVIDNKNLADISALTDINNIGRDLIIKGNDKLESLKGLENLYSVGDLYDHDNGYLLEIVDNELLKDFCALNYLFVKGIVYSYNIRLNAYNPEDEDIKSSNCSNDE